MTTRIYRARLVALPRTLLERVRDSTSWRAGQLHGSSARGETLPPTPRVGFRFGNCSRLNGGTAEVTLYVRQIAGALA
jgi:hypothetical protein